MTAYHAIEVWSNGETRISVHSGRTFCTYGVVFKADGTVHLTAPGLDKVLELDADFYPMEDEEVCAVMIVAQQEGGVLL